MYDRFVQLVIRHPIVAVILALAVTAALASRLPALHIETDHEVFIPADDDAHTNLDKLEEIFGSSYLTKIIVVRDDHPDGIYNPGTLGVVAEITAWLKERPEFETSRTVDLRSLSTVNDIRGDESGMIVEPFMEEPPATRHQALAIKRAVEDNGIYVGVLASADAEAASIIARESEPGRADRAATYFALREFLDGFTERGRPERFYVTGRPVVEGLFGLYIAEEAFRTLPIVLVLLAVFLYVSFRTPRGVLIPFAVIACTELWMFGFLAVWGRPVYTVTTILPILITAVAIADSIHLLSKYYEAQAQSPGADRMSIVARTMREMGPPVFMTSLTTAVGFLSMLTSPVRPLYEFGVVTAVGIFAALALTLVFIPALLVLLPLQPPRTGGLDPFGKGRSALDRLLVPPARLAHMQPAAVIVLFAVVTAASLLGLFRLSTDSSQIGQFRPHHHLRKADAVDNAFLAGSSILDVMVDGLQDGALKDPDLLRRIDRFQARLESLDVVGDTFSIAELIKRMNRVMNADRPDAEVVPGDRNLIAQYLLLYSISGDPGDFDDLVDYDYRHAHVIAFIRDPGTAAAKRVVDEAHRLAGELFPADRGLPAVLELAGATYTNAHLERYVNQSQVSTLLICLPALFVLTWLMFGRALLGLLAISPVVMSVVVIYGAMGLVGLPTDIATTLLGAMALGIGIDFAIHYLYRYLACLEEGADGERAATVTARTTGRALFYNAMVLTGGFMTLLAARFYPQVKLGALVSATMIICYVSTMLLFPAVLRLMGQRDAEPAANELERDRAA